MRHRLGILIACAVCLLPISCASALQKDMKSWMGSHESQLLAAWGAPDIRASLPEGGRVYTWVDVWYQQENGQEVIDLAARQFVNPVNCQKTFTLDQHGVIVSYSYFGCPKRLWEQG